MSDDDPDRAVTELLRDRLPRYPASDALRARLLAQVEKDTEQRAGRKRPVGRVVAFAGALALAAAAMVALVVGDPGGHGRADPLVEEAVNDHLRVVYAAHPVEIESGGIHQVKPWFTGRVDFAPRVAFSGDEDFPLVGGAVGYFVDRKAATFVFKRRLHTITLFVMPADGLAWPSSATTPMGRLSATVEDRRGFHVVLFQDGDLAYALVSDVDAKELLALGEKVTGPG